MSHSGGSPTSSTSGTTPTRTGQEPISIDRREFDQVCRQLTEAGVPLKADLDQAWRDFAGWRVNYDRVLLSLAALTMAPYAPWSSDRSMIERNGSRLRRHNRSRA